MSVSLYYSAERNEVLTGNEQQQVDLIIERYNQDFEYSEDAESFDLYEYDDSEPEMILSGAVKLPISMNDEKFLFLNKDIFQSFAYFDYGSI